MILGIGTDIVNISRIEDLLNKHDQKFMDRCFTKLEQEKATSRPTDKERIAQLAKLWASKEAFAKALGTGFRDGLYLKDIEVINDEFGKPFLELYSSAQDILDSKTAEGYNAYIHLSISDDYPFAVASVVIELEKEEI